jgi:hypothetical protein
MKITIYGWSTSLPPEIDKRRSIAREADDLLLSCPLYARPVYARPGGGTDANHNGVIRVFPQSVQAARTLGQGWAVSGLVAGLLRRRPACSGFTGTDEHAGISALTFPQSIEPAAQRTQGWAVTGAADDL